MMFRNLLWKELRSCWPWAALTLVMISWTGVAMTRDFGPGVLREFDPFSNVGMGLDLRDIKFLAQFLAAFTIILGAILGLWQTLPESFGGTAPFLVHTARCRGRIVSAKIAAVGLLFAVTIVLPMVLAADRSIANSRDPVPLSWNDFRYVWITMSAGLVAYLGVLAAGLRGLPWKEWIFQLCGMTAVGAGIAFALWAPEFDWALNALAGSAGFAGLWAFTGFARREF